MEISHVHNHFKIIYDGISIILKSISDIYLLHKDLRLKINSEVNMQKNQLALLLILSALFFLSGCSDGPSSEDIKSAMMHEFDKASAEMDQMDQLLGGEGFLSGMASIQVHDIIVHECKKAKEKPGYNCTVEVDATTPMTGRNQAVETVRFVETDRGWIAVN